MEYSDGSVLAQLGNPDMRTPIAHALAWPERISSGVLPLNLFDIAHLDFKEPDPVKFPCLRLASDAMLAGGTATVILNAANEVAVFEFLQGKIKFTAIARVVEDALVHIEPVNSDSIENYPGSGQNDPGPCAPLYQGACSMIDVLQSIAAFIVALGLLITFHEFGHYWVARRCDVKVLRFSIWFWVANLDAHPR